MNATALRTAPWLMVSILVALCVALSTTANARSPYRNGHYSGEEIEVGTNATSFDVRGRKVKHFYLVTEGTCTSVATGKTSPEAFIANDSLTPAMRISKSGRVSRTFEVADNGRVLKIKLKLRLFGGSKGTVSLNVSNADSTTETCSASRKIDVRIGGT